uniref:MIF4G domain-containing protein n=1 Tax=Anas zonorhyncha TaxID=75864 RepID=A0A8B9UPI0_9AVES
MVLAAFSDDSFSWSFLQLFMNLSSACRPWVEHFPAKAFEIIPRVKWSPVSLEKEMVPRREGWGCSWQSKGHESRCLLPTVPPKNTLTHSCTGMPLAQTVFAALCGLTAVSPVQLLFYTMPFYPFYSGRQIVVSSLMTAVPHPEGRAHRLLNTIRIGKGKYEDSDSINLNDIEKVLPVWQGYHPLPHEDEIAHTKKLFRRRRNDRRRQQRLPGGNKSQQHTDHQQGGTKHNRDHQKLYQGGQAPHSSGRTGHHGYSQNRRWHHNQKHSDNDKEMHRNAKETENLKIEDTSVCMVHNPVEMKQGPEAVEKQSQQYIQEPETKRKDSIHEHIGERPKINLLQSSKDRLRRRLKEKTPCLSLFTDQDEVTVETTNPEKNKMDKLIEILNSMRNNSSDVDSKLTTFMEEAQNSTNSEEMLGEIVKTIYQKAVTDRSFASTAAKLCDKMALFMVEGTKFRSLLLNMLQKDFTMREELQQRDVERWLGFITFLCEVFGTMRSSTGEPFRVLVCPIYTCLRERAWEVQPLLCRRLLLPEDPSSRMWGFQEKAASPCPVSHQCREPPSSCYEQSTRLHRAGPTTVAAPQEMAPLLSHHSPRSPNHPVALVVGL